MGNFLFSNNTETSSSKINNYNESEIQNIQANSPEFHLNTQIFTSENLTISELISKFINSSNDIYSISYSKQTSKSSLTKECLNLNKELPFYHNQRKIDVKPIKQNPLSLPIQSYITKEENDNNNKKNEDNINNISEEFYSPRKENQFFISNYDKITYSPQKKIHTTAGSLLKDIRKEYKFQNILGGGHFGTVRIGFRRKEQPRKHYAIKSISKQSLSEKDLEELIKEVEIISGLDHPNIVKFYETYHDEYYFHIVMELCKGKEVFDRIVEEGCIEEKKVSLVIMRVLHAISYCHSRGITHRDLKPENILFESHEPDAEIKLIDFGLSRKYSTNIKMHTILGTPYYVAPEVLQGEYDEKCDIWSIGALAYIMICGEPPFKGSSNNEIFNRILNENVKFDKKWDKISDNAKSFVNLCLNKNPELRPIAVEALKHPWFKEILEEVHSPLKIKSEILMNLKQYSCIQKLKKMVYEFLIHLLNQKEIKKYKDAFYAMDLNHAGSVNASELKESYEIGKVDITEEEINTILLISDEMGKGSLDYHEFLIACIDKGELLTKEKLKKAFVYFDVNNSGFIEVSDLKDALLRYGKQINDSKDVIEIMNKVTNAGAKPISIEDFFNIFNIET